MKITIELPEWTEERNIRIFAGIELVATKFHKYDKWRVKKDRCNWCGDCCSELPTDFLHPVIDGRCVHLKREPGPEEKYLCRLGFERPYGCCCGEPGGETCSITYEEQDLEGNLL